MSTLSTDHHPTLRHVDREAIGIELQAVLAILTDLALTGKHAHWNVAGPELPRAAPAPGRAGRRVARRGRHRRRTRRRARPRAGRAHATVAVQTPLPAARGRSAARPRAARRPHPHPDRGDRRDPRAHGPPRRRRHRHRRPAARDRRQARRAGVDDPRPDRLTPCRRPWLSSWSPPWPRPGCSACTGCRATRSTGSRTRCGVTATLEWEHVRHEEAAAFAACRRGRAHRRARRLRGELRPGQPAPDQRPLRRQPQPRARAGDRRAHPARGDRQRATSRRRTRRSCSASAASTASWSASPEQLPRVLEIAMRTALEQRGVAVLVVPGRRPGGATRRRPPSVRAIRAHAQPSSVPSDAELDAAAAALNGAERSTILAGAGCEGAHDEVVALAGGAAGAGRAHAARQGVPRVRQPVRRRHDRPARASPPATARMEECDALLMLGTDFPYRDFYPEHATVIQVDVARRADRAPHRGRRPAGRHGQGHRRGAAAAAGPERTDGRHLERMRPHYAKTRAGRSTRSPRRPEPRRRCTRSSSPATIDELADRRRHLHPRRRHPRDLGGALPAHERPAAPASARSTTGRMANARAAGHRRAGRAAGAPGRHPVRRRRPGDDARRPDHPPAATAAGEGRRVQQRLARLRRAGDEGRRLSSTSAPSSTNPNFAAVATRAGHARPAGRAIPTTCEAALRAAFAHDGPALVEVMVARQELSIPPTITPRPGEGLHALRRAHASCPGRGDELIDLARTNPLRRLLRTQTSPSLRKGSKTSRIRV